MTNKDNIVMYVLLPEPFNSTLPQPTILGPENHCYESVPSDWFMVNGGVPISWWTNGTYQGFFVLFRSEYAIDSPPYHVITYDRATYGTFEFTVDFN